MGRRLAVSIAWRMDWTETGDVVLCWVSWLNNLCHWNIAQQEGLIVDMFVSVSQEDTDAGTPLNLDDDSFVA